MKTIQFNGNFIIIGFGSVAAPLIPLLFKTFDLTPERVKIITSDERNKNIADHFNLKLNITPLSKENYKEVLGGVLKEGDFLVNLSVDVCSLDLIKFAAETGALYMDTCIEPWKGFYTNENLSTKERTNYALRKQAMALKNILPKNSKTAIVAHGMNPGTVSHFVKAGLVKMAEDAGLLKEKPQTQKEWANLAKMLNIKVIHIAEHDTQISRIPKQANEFVNTWSVDGLLSEGIQPAELGWGSHEKILPADGMMIEENAGTIILNAPGIRTRVKTWTPITKECEGFVITHNEAISISQYLETEGYRPTCHYAYHPCVDAISSIHDFCGRGYERQENARILSDEIITGTDELGVLLMGGEKALWFGSLLNIEEARKLAPFNSATSLQITSGVLSAICYAIAHPDMGLIEADDMDFEFALEISKPYLGEMVAVYTDFTPLKNRKGLFQEDLDEEDPFQFKNFRI